MKYYLSVPYEEKDQASELGAKWDAPAGLWYTNKKDSTLLLRWPLKIIPYKELKGEDRKFGGKTLFVDLIPKSCWFTNVRYCIDPADWDALRRYIYMRAGHRCECCGIDGDLEAHERWHYDETQGIQKLIRLIALCRDCHESTHIGLAEIKGRGYFAKRHLMRVTDMTEQEAEAHIEQAFNDFEKRSQRNWILDLSIIENSNIRIIQPIDNLERSKIVEEKVTESDVKYYQAESKSSSYLSGKIKKPFPGQKQSTHASNTFQAQNQNSDKFNFQNSSLKLFLKGMKHFFSFQGIGLLGISTILIGLVFFIQTFPGIFGPTLTPFVQALIVFIFLFVALEACRKSLISIIVYIGIGVGGYFLAYWHIFNIYHYLAPIFIHTITVIGLIGTFMYVAKRR